MDTLIAFAAPIVTLIGSVAALFGVWLTQRSNRQTKKMELEHARKLKLIELREQSARMIRDEKRAVYVEMLRNYRKTVQYWARMGEMSLQETLEVDTEKMEELTNRFNEQLAELELVASPAIFDMGLALHMATQRCSQTHREVTERLFDAHADLLDERIRSPEQIRATTETIWEKVRGEIRKTYEEQTVLPLYLQLRNQIREELGFMALNPELVPTDVELDELREELDDL